MSSNRMAFQPDLFNAQPGWHDQVTTRKGDLGEAIAVDFLRNTGTVNAIYRPEDIGTAHNFDLVLDLIGGGQIIADVKTYSSRSIYRDTGINTEHENIYLRKQAEFGKKFFLIFVDNLEGRIYGAYLDDLLKPYGVDSRRDTRGRRFTRYPLREPCRNGCKTYFSLDSMTDLGEISKEHMEALRALSSGTFRG